MRGCSYEQREARSEGDRRCRVCSRPYVNPHAAECAKAFTYLVECTCPVPCPLPVRSHARAARLPAVVYIECRE